MSLELIAQDDVLNADSSGTTVAPSVAKPVSRLLPPYKVLLHNDDVNDMLFVVQKVIELTPLSSDEAIERMVEAHHSGVCVLLVTHKERAELYCEQFACYRMIVTAERD